MSSALSMLVSHAYYQVHGQGHHRYLQDISTLLGEVLLEQDFGGVGASANGDCVQLLLGVLVLKSQMSIVIESLLPLLTCDTCSNCLFWNKGTETPVAPCESIASVF